MASALDHMLVGAMVVAGSTIVRTVVWILAKTLPESRTKFFLFKVRHPLRAVRTQSWNLWVRLWSSATVRAGYARFLRR